MLDIKVLLGDIPKTWRGKMFLFLLILMIIAFIVMLKWPSIYTVGAFVGMVVVIIISICLLGSEPSEKKQEAKRILGRRLEEFRSCWDDFKEKHIENKYINLDFQNELVLCGNTLKKAVEDDERLLPKTSVDEANNIADTFIDLANSLRSRMDKTSMATDAQKQRIYQEVLEEGDRIVRTAKELVKKLGVKGNE